MRDASKWWDDWWDFWWEFGYRVNDAWFVCGDCGMDGPGFHACEFAMRPTADD